MRWYTYICYLNDAQALNFVFAVPLDQLHGHGKTHVDKRKIEVFCGHDYATSSPVGYTNILVCVYKNRFRKDRDHNIHSFTTQKVGTAVKV